MTKLLIDTQHLREIDNFCLPQQKIKIKYAGKTISISRFILCQFSEYFRAASKNWADSVMVDLSDTGFSERILDSIFEAFFLDCDLLKFLDEGADLYELEKAAGYFAFDHLLTEIGAFLSNCEIIEEKLTVVKSEHFEALRGYGCSNSNPEITTPKIMSHLFKSVLTPPFTVLERPIPEECFCCLGNDFFLSQESRIFGFKMFTKLLELASHVSRNARNSVLQLYSRFLPGIPASLVLNSIETLDDLRDLKNCYNTNSFIEGRQIFEEKFIYKATGNHSVKHYNIFSVSIKNSMVSIQILRRGCWKICIYDHSPKFLIAERVKNLTIESFEIEDSPESFKEGRLYRIYLEDLGEYQ